jgi:putative ABC transport system substrate-binding protein
MAPAAAFTVILTVVLLAAPLAANAQAGKVYKIGWLLTYVPVGADAREYAGAPEFWETLRQLDYEKGRNLVLEERSTEGKLERLPGLATELVDRKPDVLISTFCGTALNALRKATTTIPIVVQVCQDDRN